MSGRKYSEVALANSVREAIACRLAADAAVVRAEALVHALRDASIRAPALHSSAETASTLLQDIRAHLSSIRRDFDESRMMQLDIADVRHRHDGVRSLVRQLDDIAKRCRDGEEAAATRAEIVALLEELEAARVDLSPWLHDVYDQYVERTTRLLAATDEHMQTTGTIGPAAAVLPAHLADLAAMREKAATRRTQDAERHYIARALQKVCTEDLGFTAAILPQRTPLDDLIVEVNTFAYGILHFRLQLDGTVRSESELVETTCCANFAAIEDKLKSLGVISAFRYEDTQLPVRLARGANELPGGEPLGAAIGKQL